MPWGPDVETNLAISSANHLKVRFIQQSLSTVIQIIIVTTGQSNTIGLRDSLLYSTLWLIPALFFSRHIKLVAAIIGIFLWLSSAIALAYYIVYGQQCSQSVMFIMFETNTHEASEFLTQYLSIKVIASLLVYTLIAIFFMDTHKTYSYFRFGQSYIDNNYYRYSFWCPFLQKSHQIKR
ncbi:phosphoethanolamine transferase CptA [Arsenophonus endosymbiont of Aphis craccivora]|uniref:phosphoethanolamine transferase CptA n=1 Tax=Arsenophonus endosymbiont of Aphis craccivora TaxID=1231049 RepID=UPI001EE2CC9F|nr:phosphoethanolamine transferase CptA [Arsenophonus endosymbiont of Aphis craccivora]